MLNISVLSAVSKLKVTVQRDQASGIRKPAKQRLQPVGYGLPICEKHRYLVRQNGIFAENVALP
jgi:hypothetical protein